MVSPKKRVQVPESRSPKVLSSMIRGVDGDAVLAGAAQIVRVVDGNVEVGECQDPGRGEVIWRLGEDIVSEIHRISHFLRLVQRKVIDVRLVYIIGEKDVKIDGALGELKNVI